MESDDGVAGVGNSRLDEVKAHCRRGAVATLELSRWVELFRTQSPKANWAGLSIGKKIANKPNGQALAHLLPMGWSVLRPNNPHSIAGDSDGDRSDPNPPPDDEHLDSNFKKAA